MPFLLKIGFTLDILSLIVFALRLGFDAPALIPIQMGFFIPGVILITMGIIKMRQIQNGDKKS